MVSKFINLFKQNKFSIKNIGNKNSTINNIFNFFNSKEELDTYLLPKIKKSDLTEGDKLKFVNIDNVDNLIKRYYFDNENNKDEINYIWDKRETINLIEITSKINKVILLGNPGLGKSTELQQFANNLWHDKNSEYIPIYRNLKDFTNEETIENYIIKDWNRYEKLIFVLDGIDEIANIENFKSKLEIFIRNIEIDNRNYKFILSCRTNIYESIVKSVSEFKQYYLKDLTYEEGIQLLTTQCGDIVNSFEFQYNDLITSFLKNPFQIKILANYINTNKKLPSNVAELWSNYIKQRLANDEEDKSSKTNLNIYRLKENSKRVSLVNELMKVNVISGENIFKVVNKDYIASNEFKRNPLTEKLVNSDNYTFEHRNLQEYFAAFYISEFDIERIKQIILIENTKSHPSLFNVISLLLDILDCNSNKFKELIDWFVNNEPEILFKSDSNRLSKDIRIEVFKKYFHKQCIEKKHWINSNNVFSVLDISRFGDFDESIEYLLGIINNRKYNIRTILSAYDLLGRLTIPYNKIDYLKKLFISTLTNSQTKSNEKAQIIRCINDLKFIKDQKYFDEIYKFMLDEEGNEINSSFLGLINDYENVDSIFEYILFEFKRVHHIVKRNDNDDVSRGNNWNLANLMLELKDSNHFIELISYNFMDDFNLDFYEDDSLKILNRCVYFTKTEADFVIRLLKKINGKTDYFRNEKLLKEIIVNSDSNYKSIKYLIENNDFSKVKFFISEIFNEESFKLIVFQYKLGFVTNEQIEEFRNLIWRNNNSKLSENFNKLMYDNGFSSEKQFHTIEEVEKELDIVNNRHIRNFEILFNPQELLQEINNIYVENNVIEIDYKIMSSITSSWYKSHNSFEHNSIDTSIKILASLLREYDKLSFEKVNEIFVDNIIIYSTIKDKIENNKNSNIKFEVTKKHISVIENWCISISKKINFNDLIKTFQLNQFRDTINQDYKKLKLIFYFMKKFDFNFENYFLLNCIEFFDIDDNSNRNDYSFLINKIGDKVAFDNRIMENLNKSNQLFNFSLSRHIDYALDNKLESSYKDIRKSFLLEGYEYNLDNKIEKYYDITKDKSLLIKCCENIKSYKCWASINILIKQNEEKEFCFNKAIEYLNLNENSSNYHISKAFETLFELNRIEAISYYLIFLKNEISVTPNEKCFFNYNVEVDYDCLKELFNIVYHDSNNKFKSSNFNSFINSYISNLSKHKASYDRIQEKLINLIEDFEKEDFDSGLYFINYLIDDSRNTYINQKIKNYSFDDAFELLGK